MIELIPFDRKDRWDQIVWSFQGADVYYTNQYAASFMEIEDGTPYLLHYEAEDCRLCYPIIEKDIAVFSKFSGLLEKGTYRDWNTPYGYGGPLSDVEAFTDAQQTAFQKELFALAKERHVVSQFLRFHPLLQNHRVCSWAIENVYIKDTIFINMDTQEDLMVQMDPKNRNLIRKAQKNDVVITHDSGEYIDEFMAIYADTMDRDHARAFYYFPKSYYEFMQKHMADQTEYFYAWKDGKMIAASIFFYSGESMHYHLSGNLVEYRTFAPTNLLLYEAANWGREIGMKAMHLGGGLGIEDSLFHFKKQFNKQGRIGFCIGRNIFDREAYDQLLQLRKQGCSDFDMENGYYIQYRNPDN